MSDDKIQFESEMLFDLTRANQQLLQFQKKLKSQQVEVNVKFDKNSANAVDRLTSSISALKRAGKGLDQFNIDMLDLRKNLSSFSNVPAFTKTAKNINDLANSFLDLKNVSKSVGPTNEVLTNLNKHLGSLAGKAKGMADVGNFFRNLGAGINSLSKASANIDNIEKSMARLLNLVKTLKGSGSLDLLGQLPGNFGMSTKGRVFATPVKIVAPSMEEFSLMRNRWESEMARRPIRAKIKPEMDNRGLQKFQNLLIALSFGQFEAQLRRMSGAMIGNFSQIENAQTTLRTVYRDQPNKAPRAYQFLADYEQKTPFSFEEVIKGGTQFAVQETELKRVGFDLERVVRMSGELAAAFNGDIGEIQTGISRVLSGDQNGLEILDKYGISRGVLKSQGVAIGPQGLKLSSQGDIRAVLEAMESFALSKTGGNLAERRGETTQGVISNLQSQFFKTQAALFEPVSGAFKEGAKIATSFFKVISELPEPIRAMIGGVTLVTSAFLMVAQQASSLGLVLLGMNNAGLFDRFKRGGAAVATEAGGTALGNAAGSAVGAGVGSWAARNTPTLVAGAAGVGAFGTAVAVGLAEIAIVVTGVVFDIVTGFTAMAAAIAAVAPVVGLLTLGFTGLAAAAVGIIGTLGTVAALVIDPKGTTKRIGSAVGSAWSGFQNMTDFVSGGYNERSAQENYRDRWFGNNKAARKRQRSLARGKEILGMTGEEMVKSGVGKGEISASLATTMQAEKEAMDAGDTKRAGQLQNTIQGLIDKRRDYNELIKETIDLQTAEMKMGLDIANAQKDLGIATQAQVLQKAEERSNQFKAVYDRTILDKRPVAEQRAAYLDWLNALKDVKGAHDGILASQRAMLDNAAELRMGTGGTAKEEVDYLFAQANLMPNATPEEKAAQEAAFNKARIRQYELGKTREDQITDFTGLRGDTLGQRLRQIAREKQEAIEATSINGLDLGGASGVALTAATGPREIDLDRTRIEESANLKIKQARADHYLGLLKLAQDNLQQMQKLEQDRIQMLQGFLQKEKSMRLAAQSRTSIEEQFNKQKEIKDLDSRIAKGIQDETALKLKQAEEAYQLDLKRLNLEKDALGPNAKQERKSKDKEILLRKETFKGEKEHISVSGKQALEEFQQESKFRQEDLDLAAQIQILEDESQKAAIEKERIQNRINTGKSSYIDLIKAELAEEKKILTANLMKALRDKKLTSQQRKNLEDKYSIDIAAADTAAAGQISDSKVSAAKIAIGGAELAMGQNRGKDGKVIDPKTELVNLKRKLEQEKIVLYEEFKKRASAPGADLGQEQQRYMQDLTNLQQRYLDQAKQVTDEFEAQNNALKSRQGFTMGEVFGIESLAENMAADSAESRAKYDAIGGGKKGPFNGIRKQYQGYGPGDPFSKDRWEVNEELRRQEYEMGKLPTDSKVPGTLKDLQKVDVKAEFTLKVISPDGKTTTFRSAGNPDVPSGGKGLA